MEKINEAGAAPRSPIEVLQAARTRLARGWTQGSYARDPEGHPCDETARHAAAWCPVGALWAESKLTDRRPIDMVLAQIGWPGSMAGWNDKPERTKAEVIAAFDRAIALAEAEPRPSSLGPAPKDPK